MVGAIPLWFFKTISSKAMKQIYYITGFYENPNLRFRKTTHINSIIELFKLNLSFKGNLFKKVQSKN